LTCGLNILNGIKAESTLFFSLNHKLIEDLCAEFSQRSRSQNLALVEKIPAEEVRQCTEHLRACLRNEYVICRFDFISDPLELCASFDTFITANINDNIDILGRELQDRAPGSVGLSV
jgi:hypothetical protein